MSIRILTANNSINIDNMDNCFAIYDSAMAIYKMIVDSNFVATMHNDIQRDNEAKRELLQRQQNLSDDLTKIEYDIESYDTRISELKDELRMLYRNRNELLAERDCLKTELDDIHREWVQKYSATGNASF